MEQSYEEKLWQDMAFVKVEFPKNKIKEAGRAVTKSDFSKISEPDAYKIINNWRAAHSYPMQVFYMNCRRKAAKINAIAVERLKRMESIIDKLEREENMSLLRMQDLGGCRIITNKITDIYATIKDFKNSDIKHKLIKENNYIEKPKESGYRSIHMIYSYYSNKKSDYNGMFIEVQIRTALQHLWATAVEVLSLYTKHNLKASQGDARMLRFMELISALFSIEEHTQISSHVPPTVKGIIDELKNLEDTNVLELIGAIQMALDNQFSGNEAGYYIFDMDFDKKKIQINFFGNDITKATAEYEKIESESKGKQRNAVLVSGSSIKTLRKAYPNYFADVTKFRKKVNLLLTKNNGFHT